MPELPEVEANMRNLRQWTRGRTITRVVAPPGTRESGGLGARAFAGRLRGRMVSEVERRGKWILVRLSAGGGLGLHLGMTGKLARAGEPPRFARAELGLDDGTRVFFVDSRRFGKLLAEPWDELVARAEVQRVGPDALDGVDAAGLAAGLIRTARPVHAALLDQRILSGVGNLYATEALWRAEIHPLTPARSVAGDRVRVRRLLTVVRAALRHGLRTYEGVELPEYIEEGGPNPFYAYDRKGLPCKRCGATLEAAKIGGRTAVYCPRDQRLAEAGGVERGGGGEAKEPAGRRGPSGAVTPGTGRRRG